MNKNKKSYIVRKKRRLDVISYENNICKGFVQKYLQQDIHMEENGLEKGGIRYALSMCDVFCGKRSGSNRGRGERGVGDGFKLRCGTAGG